MPALPMDGGKAHCSGVEVEVVIGSGGFGFCRFGRLNCTNFLSVFKPFLNTFLFGVAIRIRSDARTGSNAPPSSARRSRSASSLNRPNDRAVFVDHQIHSRGEIDRIRNDSVRRPHGRCCTSCGSPTHIRRTPAIVAGSASAISARRIDTCSAWHRRRSAHAGFTVTAPL